MLFVADGQRSGGPPGMLGSFSCRHRILLTSAPPQARCPHAIDRSPAAPPWCSGHALARRRRSGTRGQCVIDLSICPLLCASVRCFVHACRARILVEGILAASLHGA